MLVRKSILIEVLNIWWSLEVSSVLKLWNLGSSVLKLCPTDFHESALCNLRQKGKAQPYTSSSKVGFRKNAGFNSRKTKGYLQDREFRQMNLKIRKKNNKLRWRSSAPVRHPKTLGLLETAQAPEVWRYFCTPPAGQQGPWRKLLQNTLILPLCLAWLLCRPPKSLLTALVGNVDSGRNIHTPNLGCFRAIFTVWVILVF